MVKEQRDNTEAKAAISRQYTDRNDARSGACPLLVGTGTAAGGFTSRGYSSLQRLSGPKRDIAPNPPIRLFRPLMADAPGLAARHRSRHAGMHGLHKPELQTQHPARQARASDARRPDGRPPSPDEFIGSLLLFRLPRPELELTAEGPLGQLTSPRTWSSHWPDGRQPRGAVGLRRYPMRHGATFWYAAHRLSARVGPALRAPLGWIERVAPVHDDPLQTASR